jgi:hypothetical protein
VFQDAVHIAALSNARNEKAAMPEKIQAVRLGFRGMVQVHICWNQHPIL